MGRDPGCKGTRPQTIRKAYQLLAGALNPAVDDPIIDRNPTTRVKLLPLRNAEMRFLNKDEIARLASAVDDRYRVLVLTAAYSGLR